jgi:hypothetical protein
VEDNGDAAMAALDRVKANSLGDRHAGDGSDTRVRVATESRFTVEYELGGRRGNLEGRVKDAMQQAGTPNLPVEIEFDARPGGPAR